MDNFPYRWNDTSAAIEFDVDTDDMDGVLVPNTTNVDTDTVDTASGDGFTLEDNTEGQVQFNDTTKKLRWKRIVFCDGNKTVTIRSRFFVAINETPDDGFVVRRKLFVTFHIAVGVRCPKLIWDPSSDQETSADLVDTSTTTGTGSSTGSTSSTTSTATGTTTSTATGTSTATATGTSTATSTATGSTSTSTSTGSGSSTSTSSGSTSSSASSTGSSSSGNNVAGLFVSFILMIFAALF